MSRTAALGAVAYETETGWAEDVDTFTLRLNVLNRVDLSGLVHGQIENTSTMQYMGERPVPIVGVQGGQFTTVIHLPGHGTTTAGALTAREYETLLGNIIGTVTSTGTGDTATGGTATVPTTTSAANFTAGGVVFPGVAMDTRGGAQAAVVSTHAANSLTLLNALPGALTNGDVIYSSRVVHPYESIASATCQSYRFLLFTGNMQVSCHGCWPMSIKISGLGNNEAPIATITWGVSAWKYVSTTFPSALTPETYTPAACAGGSLHVATVGTATRTAFNVRAFDLEIDLGMVPQSNTGGVRTYQGITGCIRGPHKVTASFTVNEDTATATPTWPTIWDDPATAKFLVYTLNSATTGKRLAIVLPRVQPKGDKWMQMDDGGVNSNRVMVEATSSLVTTSALTQSSYRIAFG